MLALNRAFKHLSMLYRWAMQEGYGACLIDKPEFIADMVRQANNRVTVYPFTVSVKIRIHEDIRYVHLCWLSNSQYPTRSLANISGSLHILDNKLFGNNVDYLPLSTLLQLPLPIIAPQRLLHPAAHT